MGNRYDIAWSIEKSLFAYGFGRNTVVSAELMECTCNTHWLAAIAVALTSAAVLGIAGTEILKVMKKKWNHLYLFYLILSMAITVAMGELINRVIPLNQILTGGLLYIVFLLLNWQITSHVSR